MGCSFILWENGSPSSWISIDSHLEGVQIGFKREETQISRINIEMPGNYFTGPLQMNWSTLLFADLFQVVITVKKCLWVRFCCQMQVSFRLCKHCKFISVKDTLDLLLIVNL